MLQGSEQMARLGKEISEAREKRGWTQVELARRLKERGETISQGTISRLEAGTTDRPKPETLDAVAAVLDLDAEWLKFLAGIRNKDAIVLTPEERRVQALARSLAALPAEIHDLISRASGDKKALRILQLMSVLSRLPAEDQAMIIAEVLAKVQSRTEPEPSPDAD